MMLAHGRMQATTGMQHTKPDQCYNYLLLHAMACSPTPVAVTYSVRSPYQQQYTQQLAASLATCQSDSVAENNLTKYVHIQPTSMTPCPPGCGKTQYAAALTAFACIR